MNTRFYISALTTWISVFSLAQAEQNDSNKFKLFPEYGEQILDSLTAYNFFHFGVPTVAGEIIVTISGPGAGPGDTIFCGQPVIFELRLNNTTGNTILGQTNGFVLHTPGGATWTPGTTGWGPLTAVPYDSNRFVNTFSYDGLARDTIGFGAFLIPPSTGIAPGFNDIFATIEITVPCSDTNLTVCIDSSFYPPIGVWKWSTSGGDNFPTWTARCFIIAEGSCCNLPGDADDGGDVNIGDATFIVKYIFQNGDTPPCCDEGDADGGGDVNIGDAVYIVKFVFVPGSPAPVCPAGNIICL